ncbi:MAG: CheR family methyltransferase [Dethiobacteria bacterium]|jgi:chemotaxis protein methyltransferase CheR
MSFLGSVGELSTRDFQTVRQVVYKTIGINLTEAKRALVVSRLSKRLRELELETFAQYLQFLQESPGEAEIMFNYLTTNVTRFFREQYHFEYLCLECLPYWESRAQKDPGKKKIRAWSAGCSTGEEPYTIAMVLNDYFQGKKEWSINILASDVNTSVLEKARAGIYTQQEVEGIPYSYLKKYFKLGTGSNKGFFKVKKMLQDLVAFHWINLASPEKYPAAGFLDLIFCRNVFIYFDREIRSKILERFHRSLRPGGLLFLGHSESINTMDGRNGRWRVLRHTVYERIP